MKNETLKEVAALYNRRESLLRDLDIIDKHFDKDDIVATIGLGIGEYSLLEFMYLNDTKSVLKVVRNNLLIEINDINKQIDKL